MVEGKKTWLQKEEYAYPDGGQTRKGQAICELDGKVYTVWAGIPDTFWTIPAHMKKNGKYVSGFLTVSEGMVTCLYPKAIPEGELVFHPHEKHKAKFKNGGDA